MQACPICRASLNGGTVCRRCRADLAKVQEVEQRGQVLAVAGALALLEGDTGAAAHWIARACAVHRTQGVRLLARLAEAVPVQEEAAKESDSIA
jgi:transcriptional regulator of aromatic amino acid metabolism